MHLPFLLWVYIMTITTAKIITVPTPTTPPTRAPRSYPLSLSLPVVFVGRVIGSMFSKLGDWVSGLAVKEGTIRKVLVTWSVIGKFLQYIQQKLRHSHVLIKKKIRNEQHYWNLNRSTLLQNVLPVSSTPHSRKLQNYMTDWLMCISGKSGRNTLALRRSRARIT